MSIQQDIQINKTGEVVEIVGFEDIGSEGNACNTLRKGKQEKELGTHVLQFVFLGITGFRFPFAHFVTTNIQAYDIYSLFWEAVDYLYMFGFTAIYACTDGAQSNRSFIYINLGKDPLTTISTSPCNPNKSVIFMMDISHVIKKIRNNVLKSGVAKFSTRNLTLPDKSILQWEMWVNAYKWDQQNALQLHRKLTNEHIFLTQQGKMRNHLAEEVLNSEMLNLILEYKASLANQGDILNGVLEFLKKTSKMIEVFHSTRPICTKDDERLKELAEINIWFSDWTRCVQAQKCKNADKSKQLMSNQCMEDINSCLQGFLDLCSMVLSGWQDAYLTPSLINSDVVENHFCQQRATYNGANTNPNALQYRRNLNSIILGQNIVSNKANAGKSSITCPAFSFKHLETARKRKSNRETTQSNKSIKVMRL